MPVEVWFSPSPLEADEEELEEPKASLEDESTNSSELPFFLTTPPTAASALLPPTAMPRPPRLAVPRLLGLPPPSEAAAAAAMTAPAPIALGELLLEPLVASESLLLPEELSLTTSCDFAGAVVLLAMSVFWVGLPL